MQKYRKEYDKRKKAYRIIAMRDFGDVRKGDAGGFVESEFNLSHEGNCWIYDEAIVTDQSCVTENAKVKDAARVTGKCRIDGDAVVSGKAFLNGRIAVGDFAQIHGFAFLVTKGSQRVEVREKAEIFGSAVISHQEKGKSGCVLIDGSAFVCETATIFLGSFDGLARITDNAVLAGRAFVGGPAKFCGSVVLEGDESVGGDVVISRPDDLVVVPDFLYECDFFTYTKANGLWNSRRLSGDRKEFLRWIIESNKDSERWAKPCYESMMLAVEASMD